MTAESLWRGGRLAGLVFALAGVSLAQNASQDVTQLKDQVTQLQKQIDVLSQKLNELTTGKSTQPAAAAPASAQASPAAAASQPAQPSQPAQRAYPSGSLTSSATPVAAPPAAEPPVLSPPAPPPLPRAEPDPQAVPSSPLQLQLGNIFITPVGFMDATASWKDKNAGGSLGTNFGNFPYNNVFPQSRLNEIKFSPQNSRIGFRIDGNWKGWRFIAYNENDFLGTNAANNVAVTNGAFSPRLRLFWVDTRKGKFEFLAGQSWSLLTPNRKGLSPIPGDIFYSQVWDVNYLVGLTWTRQPGYRFVYHPSDQVTMGLALENPDQYMGGSGGAGQVVLPAALTGLANSQIDNASGNVQNIPNVAPDIIAKIAFDPSSRAHIEVAGIERTFRLYNTSTGLLGSGQHFSKAGVGGSVNANLAVVKNFRLISNNYWSDGGGRYIFGQSPDFIVRSDGSISPIHSEGFNEGFEATAGKTLIYSYYGAMFSQANTALDLNGKYIGWGYPGSANSQNKSSQEFTIGFNHTAWKDAKYGAINFMVQYAYFFRNPLYLAANAPKNAHLNTIFFDVRYTLPGSAPTMLPPTP